MVTKRDRTNGISTLALVLVALVFYVSLGQQRLYGDAPGILMSIDRGMWFSTSPHILLNPVLLALWRIVDPLEITLFETASFSIAFISAIGLGFLHAASLELGLSRKKALLVTALTGLSPAVCFYATVIEYHGFFFAFSSLATLAATRLIRCPSPSRALVLGLSTGLATQAHGTGALLPVLFLVWFFGFSPSATVSNGSSFRPRKILTLVVCVLLTHIFIVTLSDAMLARSGLAGASTRSANFIGEGLQRSLSQLGRLPFTFMNEWVLPFLPLSVASLMGLFFPPVRRIAVATLIGVLLYVLASFFLLQERVEYGAYLLPLAWSAAVVTVRSIQSGPCIVLVILSLTGSVGYVVHEDDHAENENTAQLVRRAAGERPICLLATSTREIDLRYVWLSESEVLFMNRLMKLNAEQVPGFLPVFDERIEAIMDRNAIPFITDAALDFLLSSVISSHTTGAALLSEHLHKHYSLQGIPSEEPQIWRVARRAEL